METKKTASFDEVYKEIMHERSRQDIKFGEQNHSPVEYAAILGEEVGEANQAIVDAYFKYKPEIPTIREFRSELIDVAAVAHQMCEVICRQINVTFEFPIETANEELAEGMKTFREMGKTPLAVLLASSVCLMIASGSVAEQSMTLTDEMEKATPNLNGESSDKVLTGKFSAMDEYADYVGRLFALITTCMVVTALVDEFYPNPYE